MKIKITAKEMKDADVRFISLVKRGANRLPFRIIKSAKDSDMLNLTTLRPVLKGEKIQAPAKKAYSPNFAQILAGSVSRDIGTPAPAIQVAPAKPVQSIAGTSPESTHAQASGGKPITRRAHNEPKVPATIPSKGNPVEFASLRAAIDFALHEQRQREESERFNAGRSAFSRIHKSTAPDAPSGTGSAWALRNIGGRLAASVLNASTRKEEGQPVGSSALDVAFGRR
ncbi:hypothetical protein ALISP_3349 [Alicycliphilus sp. B1]|nr:hypothetical protein ALISP_3349 [Alicycliphilus sp. B1]